MVCDVMTHPEARGQGVFTKIGRYATEKMKEQKIHFTTGYPIRPEVIPGHIKVGWEKPFQLPLYLRPLKSNDLLKSKGLSVFIPFVNLGLSVFNFFIDRLSFSRDHFEVRMLSVKELLASPLYSDFFITF